MAEEKTIDQLPTDVKEAVKEIKKEKEQVILTTDDSFIKDKKGPQPSLKEKKELMTKHLTALLAFVRFVDKDLLQNRAERKQFWRDFTKGPVQRELAILFLMRKFEVFENAKREPETNTENISGKQSSQST